MPGEDSFDAPINDKDSQAFRELSISRVNQLLDEKLVELKRQLEGKNIDQITDFIIQTADDLNRSTMGVADDENIYSDNDTAIMHALGLPLWKKPRNGHEVERLTTREMVASHSNEQITTERFGKGAYFLTVLMHKYENGNGRVARSLRALIDKSSSEEGFDEEEVKTILAVGRKGITDKGGGKFEINFHPDFERLVLGICYFGLHKGLAVDTVIGEMKLNSQLPENGIGLLAEKLGKPVDPLKNEFIQFMTLDSELEWCEF